MGFRSFDLIRILAAFCLVPTTALAAACPKRAFDPPASVRLTGPSALVVTHPSVAFDGRMATKVGMDAAVRAARKTGIPVVYLQDDGPNEEYFFGDCEPDYWVYSKGGEISFDFAPAHLYTVGGHWELCQSLTLHDILYQWARKPQRDLTITVYMDAVYMKGSMSFQESDPNYGDFQRFVGIVNYGRGGEAFSNKLTMLEAMGILVSESKQADFLIRALPHYERTLPGYRVEFSMNRGRVRVLQKGAGARPPVLRFEFLDTAVPGIPAPAIR